MKLSSPCYGFSLQWCRSYTCIFVLGLLSMSSHHFAAGDPLYMLMTGLCCCWYNFEGVEASILWRSWRRRRYQSCRKKSQMCNYWKMQLITSMITNMCVYLFINILFMFVHGVYSKGYPKRLSLKLLSTFKLLNLLKFQTSVGLLGYPVYAELNWASPMPL